MQLGEDEKEAVKFKDENLPEVSPEMVKISREKARNKEKQEQISKSLVELGSVLLPGSSMDMDKAKEVYDQGELRVKEVDSSDKKRLQKLMKRAEKDVDQFKTKRSPRKPKTIESNKAGTEK